MRSALAVRRSRLVPAAPTAAGSTPPGTPRARQARPPPPPPPARPAPPARRPTGGRALRLPPRARRHGAAPRPAGSGSARSTRNAASAAPADDGARPVSKMNERAVSTRCADHRLGPEHRATLGRRVPWTASRWPRRRPRPRAPPRPAAPARRARRTPSPCASSTTSSAPPRPAHGMQRAQRGGVAVHAVDALHHHQRPLLVPGGEHRVHRGGVVVRHHRDPGPGQPAGVDDRRVVRRVGDDECIRDPTAPSPHRGSRRSRRRTPAPAANPQNAASSRSSAACSSVVPVTSREPVDPAPQARAAAIAPSTTRGSRERPR